MKLIREKAADQHLLRREWWKIANNCKAVIIFGNNHCSLGIANLQKEDITKSIAKQMGITSEGKDIKLTSSIDCYLIECPKPIWKDLLKRIEDVCIKLGY